VSATPLRLVPATGAPVEVQGERVLVGRDPAADVVLNDPSISRRHAVIERRGVFWVVLDQQSANGTWIDGRRVTEAALESGQRLRLGAVEFTVAGIDPKAKVPPAPARAYVRPAGAPPAPSAARPAAAPAPGAAPRMDLAEAAEMLGLWPGSPPEEVRKRYQKMYNDFQIRLTNAPTPSLKKMYQKNLQDLRAAAEALAPGVT
jgi:predicted component of type VI protein secretion system